MNIASALVTMSSLPVQTFLDYNPHSRLQKRQS